MPAEAPRNLYRTTESKYKGGAHENYVTYDLQQRTRGGTAGRKLPSGAVRSPSLVPVTPMTFSRRLG